MRPYLTFSGLLLAGAVPVAAQDAPPRAASVGPAAGVLLGIGINTVLGGSSVEPRVGGTIGGFLTTPLRGPVRLRYGLQVSRRSVHTDRELVQPCLVAPCQPISERLTFQSDYLELPLEVEARIGHWNSERIRLTGGPYLGWRLACGIRRQSFTGIPAALIDARSEGCDALPRRHDAGVRLGLGLDRGDMAVMLQWTGSLTAVADPGTQGPGGYLIGGRHAAISLLVEFTRRKRGL